MMTILIDDDGEVWSEGSSELSAQLSTDRVGSDLRKFAVESLGFIHLSRRGRAVSVQFDKQVVSSKALCGLLYWAFDHRHLSFFVETGARPATPLLVPTPERLVDVVARICDERASTPDYAETAVAIEHTVFASRWAVAREVVDRIGLSEHAGTVLDELFAGHWTISEFNAERRAFEFVHLGQWYHQFDPQSATFLVGKRPADFNDTDYGRRVDRCLAPLQTSVAPRTLRVSALIKWGRRPAERFNYTRLFVPVPLGSGRRLLLSAAAVEG